MTVRFSREGCKIETTFLQAAGALHESITLSVDPASALSIAVEESAGQPIAPRVPVRGTSRVRATKFGFQVINR